MRVVATITSKFGQKGGYYGRPVARVESYSIDSALDTDADTFSMDIGDPNSELVEIFKRDSEVRIGLSAALNNQRLVPLLKGFADTIALTHDGILSFSGRDLSAAAVDDTAIPYNWHNARPEVIITQQARARGISRFRIAPITPIRSLYTDGSESVWAFWYRMVRLRQQWIWVDSIGTLNVDTLNYGASVSYYFGKSTSAAPQHVSWIRVMEAEIQKNTQGRVAEVWVFGDTGVKSFQQVKIADPKIAQWIKKPLSIVLADSAITTRAEAIKEANEQIFEGMVGELEILIRITDPGWIVQQNKIAFLNLPTMGLSGEFFVVGVKLMGDTTGPLQEIRLREKKYALTQRIPASPQLTDDSINFSPQGLGNQLGIGQPNWGEYFVVAAQAWHGGWDFQLFLAALLAIANQETGMRNIRQYTSGSPEVDWYENPNETVEGPAYGTPIEKQILQWKKDFANDAANPLNPFSPNEAGVGPMQLTTHDFKIVADRRFGLIDEYEGGRWHPAANIWAGAQVLVSKAQGLPQTEANLWVAIQAYNGSGPAAVAYMKKVRQAIVSTWLPSITSAVKLTPTLPANSTATDKVLAAGTPDTVRKIINFAERQLGKAYGWGTDGPDTFDCSGLAFAAYQAAGLSANIGGRQSTTGYWNGGQGLDNLYAVKKDQLKVGDMVFFDNGTTDEQPAHMGIYYGDGQMIVAPKSGQVIQIQSISEEGLTFMGGMRSIGTWNIGVVGAPIYAGTP